MKNVTGEVELIGYPGTTFYRIHSIALSSLSISIIISTSVIIYILNEKPRCNIGKKKRVERFVIYLQGCDLLFNISHMSDHIFILATETHPPENACLVFAFFLQQFVMGTPLMAMAIACNTFLMVVLDKKFSFGRFDWRLWLVPMGLPFIMGICGVTLPYFGPSGAWCFIDSRVAWKGVMNVVHSVIMILVFFVNCGLYLLVWIRIKSAVSRLIEHNPTDHQANVKQRKLYHSGYSMTVFLSAFVLQYTAWVVCTIWAFIATPPPAMIMVTVFFTNMGGFFNFIAYTAFRRCTTHLVDRKERSHSTINFTSKTPITTPAGTPVGTPTSKRRY